MSGPREQTNTATVVLAGGGTGGHLYPALAIAEALKELRPDIRLVFAGTAGKIEERVVPEHGYRFVRIWISGMKRGAMIDNMLLPLKIAVSLVQSLLLMIRERPAAVVGTGGYVCGPVLFASSLMGVFTVLHESNSSPGVTTRMLAGRVSKVYLGFDDARRLLPRARLIATVGTPVRSALRQGTIADARAAFGLAGRKPVLLILGGSQGAASINAAVLSMTDRLLQEGIEMIWQTGQHHYENVVRSLGPRRVGWVGPFITDMARAYAAADLVLCRAGATTLAELTACAKPAVLVPYPHAAGDHQTRNAESLERSGAAVMVPESALMTAGDVVLDLLRSSERRRRMSAASAAQARPDAARVMATEILAGLEGRQTS